MEYGICNLSMIPLRGEAKHSGELVSQLLFGETYEVMERDAHWIRIITTFDGYEGWIHQLQFAHIDYDNYWKLYQLPIVLTRGVITAARKEADNSVLYLPFGSSLPFYDSIRFGIGYDDYRVDNIGNLETFLEIAYSFLNVPYLWGGRTHYGIDCSGYVQAVLRTQGIQLKRDASQQASQGEVVDFLPSARLGDLAFFDNEDSRITHVGIMLDNATIIHASGKVKIDQIDDQGIYSAEQKKYTHKLRIIKRFLENTPVIGSVPISLAQQ